MSDLSNVDEAWLSVSAEILKARLIVASCEETWINFRLALLGMLAPPVQNTVEDDEAA